MTRSQNPSLGSGQTEADFGDPDAAVRVAEAPAADGLVVEVVRKRSGLHSFFTAFPESEREALKSRWRILPIPGGDGGTGGSVTHHHHHAYNSIGAHRGHHGGFVGGGHHGGGHGGH